MRLYKRGRSWYIEFERGKKRSLRTGDEREARRLFKIAKAEYLRGRLVRLEDESRVTVGEYKARFLSDRSDLADPTLRMYEMSIRFLADVVGESLPLRLVEDRRLKTFRDTLRARGVSAESVNTYLRHIRTFLNAAFAEGVLEKAVPVRMVPTGKRLPKILDGDERERVLAWALENDPDMGRVIQFVLWTGLRRSEVRGLRWENIRGGFARVVGKGNRERSVPLMPSALEAMGEPRDIGPVFPQWHPDTYSHRFKRAARAVGVRGRSFHGLRHSAATAMLESGLGLRTIQRILGHAAVTTTEIYADVRDQLLADEMSKLRY